MDNFIKIGCCQKQRFNNNISGNILAFGFRCGILIIALLGVFLYSDIYSPQYYFSNIDNYIKINGDFERMDFSYSYPDIPVKRIFIDGDIKEYSIKIVKQDTIYLNNDLIPIAKPIPKNTNKKVKLVKNEKIYSKNIQLINKDYEIEKFNNGNIIELYPFDYNPLKRMLLVHTFEIEYTVNYPKAKNDEKKLYIIYSDIFEPVINDIKLFFERRNKSVNAFSTLITSNNGDSICQFIKNNYITDSFNFLLLLGDINSIPYFYGEGYSAPYTDLNYSLMDSLDYFPDFILTRLPFNNSDTLKLYFENLEISLLNKEEYNKNAYFMGTNDGTYHFIAESTHIYTMDKLRSINYETDSLFYFYPSGTPVDSAINEGSEFAFYSGHGAAYYWGGPIFSNTDIVLLQNSPYFPFIFSFACLTGKYIYHDFFGYSWLNKEKKGAIGFLGSSEESYWDEDDKFQRFIADTLIGEDYLFNMINVAKLNFYTYYGTVDLTRAYFEQYNYFSIPDYYVGNRDVNNISFLTKKYQIASKDYISAELSFEGDLSKQAYFSLFNNYTFIDSISTLSTGTITVNHSLNADDTCMLSLYIPGIYMDSSQIILIDNGPYVTLNNYSLNDVLKDTFYFDFEIMNYGDSMAYNISTFVQYIPAEFNLINAYNYVDSLMSDSSITFEKGFTIQLNEYDSIPETICTLGIIANNETLFAGIYLDNLSPNFDIEFKYSILDYDTIDALIIGARNKLYFSITNLSNLYMKNVVCFLNGKSFTLLEDSIIIDSIGVGENISIYFPVYVNESDFNEDSISFILSLGNYKDTFNMILPLNISNNYQFYGPVENYYIYTSDMIELENAPEFFDYRQYEDGWTAINFEDSLGYLKEDGTERIHLPFNFNFNDFTMDYIFLNFNGILSMDSLTSDSLYLIETLPSVNINYPSILCAWNDFIINYNSQYYGNSLNDLKGRIIYQYFGDMDKFVILYNEIPTLADIYTTYSFAIVLDTINIEIHYYNIPDSNNLIVGFQFAYDKYLALTGDSFCTSNGEPVIHNDYAVKISKEKPVYVNKFTIKDFNINRNPIIMGYSIINREADIYIGIYENKFYNISLYDMIGRKIKEFSNEFLYKGNKTIHFSLDMKGVYYLLITDERGTILSKKKFIAF